MAAQNANGMPFEISADPQNFRLLELPPILLDLIRSKDPPYLTLKSESATTNESRQSAAHAVLCTEDKTFQVRQVQSSNSVYIIQRTTKQSYTALCAIAQCPSLLELIPASPSATAFLNGKLSVYDAEQIGGSVPMTSAIELNPWDKASRHGMLEDAPFSAKEFNQAWKEICAFENGSFAWFPTTSVLADVWRAVVMAASASGLRLDESFSVSTVTSTMEEVHFPGALVMAVLARLSADDQDTKDDRIRLDLAKCVPWVGAVLLGATNSEILISDFIKQWQDELPEAWRVHARLEAIKGQYSQPTSVTIVYDGRGSNEDLETSAAPEASKAKAKPNWHEKFKNVKR